MRMGDPTDPAVDEFDPEEMEALDEAEEERRAEWAREGWLMERMERESEQAMEEAAAGLPFGGSE